MKTKNNKTELLNPEEGEDNLGDALGKRGTLVELSILLIALILHHKRVS